MKFARVIGTVVSTQKEPVIEGRKFLLIQPVNIKFEPEGTPLVAVDAVGAGEGELILFVSGSSARQTTLTKNTPCDCAIMGIVDLVEKKGSVIYDKSKEE
ncbi:MAG: EutN/CcmL family microcompartment protein [Candidatus Eremiobacteraeota bacterium]|nr:EutN/CcmL family microcompartment protein [Candidatus Eremiobacteraeota bacterium]